MHMRLFSLLVGLLLIVQPRVPVLASQPPELLAVGKVASIMDQPDKRFGPAMPVGTVGPNKTPTAEPPGPPPDQPPVILPDGYTPSFSMVRTAASPSSTTVWRMLFLVYHNTDVDYVENGVLKHMTTSLSQAEIDVALARFDRFIQYVPDYSVNEASVDATIVHVFRPVNSITAIGSSYWLSPDDIREELDTYAPPGAYDSVEALWQPCSVISGTCIPPGGWGLSVGASNWSNSATYASIIFGWSSWWDWEANSAHVYLHEWLHGVIDFYGSNGYAMPLGGLDSAGEHGYVQSPINDWEAWYRDVMTGRVWEPALGVYTGITADAWRSGTITHGPPPEPPSGGQILFTSGPSWSEPHDIYVMNDDGANVRKLTNGPEWSVDGRFSPDGSKIVFASNRTGSWYIYTMYSDGTEVQQLAPTGTGSFVDGSPDWSPDGTLIAFICDIGGICIMNTDGTNIQQVTSECVNYPRWSNDGTKIACAGYPWDIYVVDSDGSSAVNLTNSPDVVEWMPNWSPDDSALAYTRWTEPYEEYVYVMNPDGTNAHAITGNEYNSHAVWSPDGAKIAFHSALGGMLKNVFVMNADGSNPTRLTYRDDWPTDWWSACPDFMPPSGVDVLDVQAIAEHWGETRNEANAQFDLDWDGDIDIVDTMRVTAAWGTVCE